jgi:hypothetical protein
MQRRQWWGALILLGLMGSQSGCGASKADDARIQALETQVKANSDKLAEQGKSIEDLTAQLKAVQDKPPADSTAKPSTTTTSSVSVAVTVSPSPSPETSSTPDAGQTSTGTPSPSVKASVVRDIPVAKATNGRLTMWVTKLAEYHSIEELGKLIRVGTAEKADLTELQSSLAANEQKIIVLWTHMANVSAEQMELGCSFHVGPLLLRGEEGTQVPCSEKSSIFLTRHIEGGLPFESLTPPKGEIEGRLCFVVKDWFVPVKLFPENDAHFGPHPDAIAVSLK